MAVASASSPRRIAALLVLALMILVPILWVMWSMSAASSLAQAIDEQSETLQSLQTRLSALEASSNAAEANTASVYLPGETAAIAGAVLQRIVANAVETAGGRLAESEIARPDAADAEPGVVNLRVSFDADIVGLQHVIHQLETGAPILMLEGISIDAANADAAMDGGNPTLNVVLVVQGRWEA
jgi:hypothetical protein